LRCIPAFHGGNNLRIKPYQNKRHHDGAQKKDQKSPTTQNLLPVPYRHDFLIHPGLESGYLRPQLTDDSFRTTDSHRLDSCRETVAPLIREHVINRTQMSLRQGGQPFDLGLPGGFVFGIGTA
jgi:hypothetical protein